MQVISIDQPNPVSAELNYFFLLNYSSANRTMFGQNARTGSANAENFCRRFGLVFAERVRGSVDL